jgi:general secretion pathway protein K
MADAARRQNPGVGRSRAAASASQRGIALVLVLWVIALLATIAMAVVNTSRTEGNLARNRVEEARFRAAAEAAVSMTVLRLNSAAEEDHWLPDGQPHDWRFGGLDLRVHVFNESSRMDLNRTQPELLQRLFEALGLDELESEALAGAIGDWRDQDSSVLIVGAEDDEYESEGMPFGSRDAPFTSVEELNEVLGVSKYLYRVLAQQVTVHSSSGRIDASYASPEVLMALGREEEAARVAELLAEEGQTADTQPDERGLAGPVYRIRVDAVGPSAGQSATTLLRVGRGRDNGFVVYWRRFDWLLPQAPVASESPVEGA